MTAPVLPNVKQIGQAFLVGVYTFVMSFLAGLIGHGIDLEHWGDIKLAADAGIAAALAFLGWTGLTAGRHATPTR